MSGLFLFFGLLMPRTTLLLCWLTGNIPHNSTPFELDLVGSLLAPRLLIGYWGYEAHIHPLWLVLYIVFFFLAAFGGGNAANSKIRD